MIVYHLDLGETVSLSCLPSESGSVTAGSIKKVNGLTNGEMCKWVSSNITVLHFLPSPSPCVSLRQRVALWDNLPSCSLFHSEPPEMLRHQPSGSKQEENAKNEKLRKFNELYNAAYNCLTFGLISVSSLKQIVLMLSSSSPKNSFPDH